MIKKLAARLSPLDITLSELKIHPARILCSVCERKEIVEVGITPELRGVRFSILNITSISKCVHHKVEDACDNPIDEKQVDAKDYKVKVLLNARPIETEIAT
jgi:hypothetical protein